MATSTAEHAFTTLTIVKEVEMAAPLAIAFEAMLEELGPANEMPNGTPMPMVLEPRPGGRWYRDLGDNAGHYWAHVQVFKPPALLELWGPLFMSYPAINHLQYRLTADGQGTRLQMTHRSMGLIPPEVQANAGMGWEFHLRQMQKLAERRANK